MYRVYFWNYSKKTNSTSHPSVTGSVDHYDCSLMDLSGILTPTLQLNGRNPTAFNYAYIEEFRRYYYVSNWRYNLGLWTCELQVDVLASWEEDIKSSALYVLRSASKWDNSIRDTVYPMLSGTLYSDSSLPNPFNTSYGSGYFVIGIVNTDTSTVGAISYYSFTSSQFRSFMYALMSDIDNYGMFDISSDLTKLLANPFQYIVSCRWMPLEPPGGTAVSNVPIGWWSMNVAASRLGASSIPFPGIRSGTGGHGWIRSRTPLTIWCSLRSGPSPCLRRICFCRILLISTGPWTISPALRCWRSSPEERW